MKVESTGFTMSDVDGFLDEQREHERLNLAERLERASARLAEVGARVTADHTEAAGWSGHEILAHIAVLSKFYGVVVHRIATGQMTELDLLEQVNLRDVAGEQMAKLEPAELLRMAVADHERTIKTLRSTGSAALQRAARLPDGRSITAEEVARLPLINHLEAHIDQLASSV